LETVGESTVTFKWSPRCAYCQRGPPFIAGHHHDNCPFVQTQNNVHRQERLIPLGMKDSYIHREDREQALDVGNELKAVRERLDKLELRASKLEGAAGGSGGGKSEGDKKRKAADTLGGTDSPAKKKKKVKKASSEGEPSTSAKKDGGKKGGDKGKGKEKAK
jgi:hypothetical protein